jgi:Glycerophosphoryl diester phosphodiesterase family
MAEAERHRILKRANDARASARKRGVRFGGKPKLTAYQQAEALKRMAASESCRAIGKIMGVHHATLARSAGQAAAPSLGWRLESAVVGAHNATVVSRAAAVRRMHLIAHRGWSAGRDENSLAAFARAARDEAITGVEFDVSRAADSGAMVVAHDPPLYTENALTLDAALSFLSRTDLELFVELKEQGLASSVIEKLVSNKLADIEAANADSSAAI